MIQKFKCPKCKQEFTSPQAKSGKCPDCRKRLAYVGLVGLDEVEAPSGDSPVRRSETSLSELVAAQDRTTFAVRSLSMFLFISLITSLIGYGFIAASAVIFGLLVIVVGNLAALVVGVLQLSYSKP